MAQNEGIDRGSLVPKASCRINLTLAGSAKIFQRDERKLGPICDLTL